MTLALSSRFFTRMDSSSLLFPFLTEKDQDSLALVNTVTQRVRVEFRFQDYKDLIHDYLDPTPERGRLQNVVLIIKDKDGVVHKEGVGKLLGFGGSKRALELDNGRAVLIPNRYSVHWKRVVNEEVGMAAIFARLSLLTPIMGRAFLLRTPSSSTSRAVPVYISSTFESLAKKGIFFLPSKTQQDATWKRGEHFLFSTKEERENDENWDPLFASALIDIEKIFTYNLPAFGDAFNVAIVKKSDACYEIRYFGFDFASDRYSLDIPCLHEKPKETPDALMIQAYLAEIITTVFFYEFGNEDTSVYPLRNMLAERYTKILMSRMA